MGEYTPTTPSLRESYWQGRLRTSNESVTPGQADAEFDRWLAGHYATIRRDQIERDAAIADSFDWKSWSEPNRVIVNSIRAQLDEVI